MATLPKILNLVASTASAVAAAVPLWKPESPSGSRTVESGELFYMRLYAARSLPLGPLFGLLPFWFQGPSVVWVLFTAAAIQFTDAMIQFGKKDEGMPLVPILGALIHVYCGLAML
jgi:hypothetical protein